MTNVTEAFRAEPSSSDVPTVSVVIPAYNIAAYVQETLESVLAQTYTDYEVLVINDGSPDTVEFERVLAPYLHRIRYLKHSNIGAGAARNIGIQAARGKYIAFLDGDDVWLPEYLERQIRFIEALNLDMAYTDALLFGGSPYDGRSFMRDAPSKGEVNFDSLLDFRCNVITSGTVVSRRIVVEAGMFETEKVRAHDFVLWLRIARIGGKIRYQRKILLKYRVRVDSLSGDSQQRVVREIDVFGRISRLFDLSDAQKAIVARRVSKLQATLQVEMGKSQLLMEQFSESRRSFVEANRFFRSSKLWLAIRLLDIAPRLLLRMYRRIRRDELPFIPGST